MRLVEGRGVEPSAAAAPAVSSTRQRLPSGAPAGSTGARSRPGSRSGPGRSDLVEHRHPQGVAAGDDGTVIMFFRPSRTFPGQGWCRSVRHRPARHLGLSACPCAQQEPPGRSRPAAGCPPAARAAAGRGSGRRSTGSSTLPGSGPGGPPPGEIAVGGRHQAHVHLDRSSGLPQAARTCPCSSTRSSLACNSRDSSPISSRKSVEPSADLEAADLPRHGPGVSTLLPAEQLGSP